MSNARSEMSKTKEECERCGQTIPDKCPTCHQFIVEREEEDICSLCGQELDDEFEGHEFIKQKDGANCAVCNWCERPCNECPKCKRDFLTESEDEGSTEESEDDDEIDKEQDPRKNKKPKVQNGGKYRYKNF